MKKLFLLLLIISSFTFGQNAELKGVVTYFFNDNYGFKPDVGAKIYIHKIEKRDSIKSPLITLRSYELTTSIQAKINQYTTPSETDLVKYKNDLDSLKYYRNEADNYIDGLGSKKNVIILTVDGSGKYSVNLPVGFYEIIAESRNRSGLYRTKTIEIRDNWPNIIDFEFNII